MDYIRKVNQGEHFDVIIVGAGPGGICAAITLGRKGVKVLLIEASSMLGGYWTNVMMGITLDMKGKGGIPAEIARRLVSFGCATWVDDSSYSYDIESMKYLLDDLSVDAGISILFNSRVTAVQVESNRITSVLVDGIESFSFSSDFIIDGTGTGQIAYLAGCLFDRGYVNEDDMQPASLQSLVTGVPVELWHSDIHNPVQKKRFHDLLVEAGCSPSYPNPLLFTLVQDGYTYAFQINHEYNVKYDDAFGISEALIHARKEIYESVLALRKMKGWECLNLVTSAPYLGLRDTRRINGLYKITAEDGIAGKKFYDGVVPCNFCFDIHALDKNMADQDGYLKIDKTIKPYELPMRTMISADISNLFMVGRCICGDFDINSSYRVFGNAASTGQAVCLAIASISSNGSNRDVDGQRIAFQMAELGYNVGH